MLSPYVFLLGILFKAQAFKSPSIDSPEELYSLDVLDSLIKKSSQITGFTRVTKSYILRDRAAKGLNESHKW